MHEITLALMDENYRDFQNDLDIFTGIFYYGR